MPWRSWLFLISVGLHNSTVNLRLPSTVIYAKGTMIFQTAGENCEVTGILGTVRPHAPSRDLEDSFATL